MNETKKAQDLTCFALPEKKILTTEVTIDVALPDYQPAVNRVLRVSAEAETEENGEGRVDFFLLYESEEGEVYCLPASGEFVLTNAEPSTLVTTVTVREAACRVSAPRKITLRAEIAGEETAFREQTLAFTTEGNAKALQTLTYPLETAKLWKGTSAGNYSEEIPRNESMGECRVVAATAKYLVSETFPTKKGVLVRGEEIVTLTLDPANGTLTTVTRRIPTETTVTVMPVTGVQTPLPTNAKCAAEVRCTEIDVRVEEGKIRVDTRLRFRVYAAAPAESAYTADAYAASREETAENTFRTVSYLGAPNAQNANFTAGGKVSLSTLGLPTDAQPIDAAVRVIRLEWETAPNGKKTAVGKVLFDMLFSAAGERLPAKAELPIRFEGGENENRNALGLYGGDALSPRVRADGKNVLLETEVALWWVLFPAREQTVLSGVTVAPSESEMPAPRPGEVVAVYPAPGESLWEIAKSEKKPLCDLAALNAIPLPPDPAAPTDLPYVLTNR